MLSSLYGGVDKVSGCVTRVLSCASSNPTGGIFLFYFFQLKLTIITAYFTLYDFILRNKFLVIFFLNTANVMIFLKTWLLLNRAVKR